MAKKRIFAGRVGPIKYFFDENGNVVDQTGAVAPRAIAAAILAGIESIPEVEVEDKPPATPKAPKKIKQAKSKEESSEEFSLSRVTQKISSARGSTRGTMGNIADVIGRGTIAASIGSVPDLRGVAAATLDAAGVGGLVTMGGRRGSSSPGGGKNPEKESAGILLSILNVLRDNNELLQDLLYSLTAAAKGRIEAEREANRKTGEAGKGVRDEGEDPEKQSFLGKWGTIIAAALGSVYGIIQGWLKTVKYFAEALLPESLIKSIKGKFAAIGTFFDDISKSIKGKFAAIGTFFDDIFMKLKSVFSGRFEKIGAAFEEVFSKITNLFKGVGEESKLGKIISSIGGAIAKLAAPFIEAFETIKTITSGPASKIGTVFESIGGFFGKFSGIFEGVSSTAGKMMGFLDNFAGTFKFVSNIVGKLALPLMIVMTVWDTVKGMIEGYEKGGIVGAISGAVKGFFNSLIFGPLDMLKEALAWVLGAFGWTEAKKILDSFSFEKLFSDIIDGLIQSIKKMFAFITDIFDGKEATVKKQAEMLKPVKPKPDGGGRVAEAWERQYGATHNPDGTPKLTKLTPEPLKPDGTPKTPTEEAAENLRNENNPGDIPGNLNVNGQWKYNLGEDGITPIQNPNFSTSAVTAKTPVIPKFVPSGRASLDQKKLNFYNQLAAGGGDIDITADADGITEAPPAANITPVENPKGTAMSAASAQNALAPEKPNVIVMPQQGGRGSGSRPSSISPRVSSGTPSTAPVVSHMERAHLATVGVTP